jgi:type II secretory pathway pseudopilin PulG
MSTHSEVTAARPHKRLSVLALVSLLMAMPICVLTAAGFPKETNVFYTTSRVPIVLYGVFALTAVASVPAAIVARRRIRKAAGALTGRIIAAVALFLGVTGILAASILPRLVFDSHDSALYSACKSNLTRIGEALFKYAEGHGGQLPPTLQTLVDEGLDAKAFVCPTRPGDAPSFDARDVDGTGDYLYERPPSDAAWPGTPVVWDRSASHDGGVIALSVGGYVDRSPIEDVQKDLEESRRYPFDALGSRE